MTDPVITAVKSDVASVVKSVDADVTATKADVSAIEKFFTDRRTFIIVAVVTTVVAVLSVILAG